MRMRRRGAFTLIELLVVIGTIGLLAGTMTLALRDGDRVAALRSGQATLTSMLAGARGRAALTGRPAAVMVCAADQTDEDRGRYLHCAAIVEQDDSGNLIPFKGYTTLPAGVYVVPPAGSPATGNLDFSPAWSNALAAATLAGKSHWAVWFSPGGTFTDRHEDSVQGGRITLSTATPQGGADGAPIRFNNADNVRGLVISAYGAVTSFNDKADLGR